MLKILGITGKWVNAVGKPQSRHSAHRERVYAGRHIKYAACVPLSEAEEQKHTDMDRGSAGGVGERRALGTGIVCPLTSLQICLGWDNLM